ncbi:putative oxidoreductase ucpA [Macroventuria anomochaeta]|uniref:Oxidoreductase ucpA n=1 Tax=Macroventuria anomochaeta TaxID=301207 RepID=A0ACB6S6V5_9PLEO|nr:putative oxidoreductase ucpA [Macroventuria anomochaeta]KAF2629247.1 putative oxidoreductase ucpA [Macroventuria anomochaeta]
MSIPPPESGYAFVGLSNLHNDIYHSISAKETPTLHQPGKVILITGAGRGIGRAIALQYAHAGVAGIILCARTNDQLDEVESRIKAINADIRVRKQSIDVSSDSAVAALAKEVESEEDRLDVLVNNAGHSAAWIPLHESNPSDWWRTQEVNFKGPYLLTHAFLPLLLKTAEKTGHVNIVNMSSMGALQVNAIASSYNSSKLALCRLTEHTDVGYADKGVNVVSLNPGGVVTTLANQEIEILKPYLNDTPELCGGFVVWLTAEPRKWLGGRYVAAPWDVNALEQLKDEIVNGDKLKVKLVV